ncbi:hypothetical protein D3C78_1718930 [compost metagenome]
MAAQALFFEAFHQISQTIAGGIQIGMVDLLRVTKQYNFTTFSDPRHDGFHLMTRQILGFIHNNELSWNGAASYISQRLNLYAPETHEDLIDIP